MKINAAGRAEFNSALLALLIPHFLRLPDGEFVAALRGDEFRTAVKALSADGGAGEDIRRGAALMATFIEENLETETAALQLTLGVDRTRLYRGVTPEYSPPYPCEAVWRTDGVNAAEVIERTAAFYRQHGLTPTPPLPERPDYIGVELSFYRCLLTEEILARQDGEEKKAAACAETADHFRREHLLWLPDFIAAALPLAETDFYRGHLLMLRGFAADQPAV
ncbi:MAG: molecular chaperone TorD family protein [Gracilibacteraceae bacterium]|jgi:TorA maturation chaperone TorD|nr:molecular chaperone TorD family protein [Gracilibacteraceae bacterium]